MVRKTLNSRLGRLLCVAVALCVVGCGATSEDTEGGAGTPSAPEAGPLWSLLPAADSYEARVEQVAGSELDSSAASFATQGFVITATTTNSAGYTLWGAAR